MKDDRSDVSDDVVLTEKASDQQEEIDDPQNEYRVSVNETCLESYVPVSEVSGYSRDSSETNNGNSLSTQLAGNEVCSIAETPCAFYARQVL